MGGMLSYLLDARKDACVSEIGGGNKKTANFSSTSLARELEPEVGSLAA
jgi:hypothetical protein